MHIKLYFFSSFLTSCGVMWAPHLEKTVGSWIQDEPQQQIWELHLQERSELWGVHSRTGILTCPVILQPFWLPNPHFSHLLCEEIWSRAQTPSKLWIAGLRKAEDGMWSCREPSVRRKKHQGLLSLRGRYFCPLKPAQCWKPPLSQNDPIKPFDLKMQTFINKSSFTTLLKPMGENDKTGLQSQISHK